MITPEIQDKIEQVANLPTLPQVASRLLKLVHSPDTSLAEVAAVVGQDLSLSAKVLRMANSAFYGIPRTISTINNATAILGLKVINTLVLSLTVFDMFPEDRSAIFFNRKKFWNHSIGCGMIAKALAQKLGPSVMCDPEEAFCAGLLHDIGKVVMEQYMHADFQQSLRHAIRHKIPLFDAEQKILGFTHTDVAGWLTSRWELPGELLTPILYHHTPHECGDYRLNTCLCHYADWLSYEAGLSLDESFVGPSLDPLCIKQLNIPDAVLQALRENLGGELQKLAIFYSVASD